MSVESLATLRRYLATPPSEPRHILFSLEDARKVPISRSSHVRGWHPVRSDHPAVAFESSLECDVIHSLSKLRALIRIRTQPITVHFHDGRRRTRYTPDLVVELESVPASLVHLGFERRTYVEVKPASKAAKHCEQLRHQFAVLRAATGTAVALVTEADLPLSQEAHHGH